MSLEREQSGGRIQGETPRSVVAAATIGSFVALLYAIELVDTVLESLPLWFEHYNSLHPHKALGYHSPREFIASRQPG